MIRPLCCFLLAVLASGWAFGPAARAESRRSAVVEVVESVKAAVVNIHSERHVHGPHEDLFIHMPLQNRVNGMGTGVLIDPRGYIVTNHHVVEDVQVLRVRLADGSSHSARVIARDAESDLALLKIDAGKPLPTVPLGTASDLMVGETVIAIGNAYGYEHTVTVGVVSALKRDVSLNKEVSYKSLIQTDASINPGNSGGPLLNIQGELVGINVAIRAGAQGISFAIPVETMIRVVTDMISVRRRNGTWHGLIVRNELKTCDDEICYKDGKRTPRRLIVESVEAGSPAAKAGLTRGDILVQVDNTRVACSYDLERALLDYTPGSQVPFTIRRQGSDQRVDLVLQTVDRSLASSAELVWRKLGVRLRAVEPDVVERVSKQLHGGLAIIDIQPDGLAARSGMQRGDILVGLHQWEMMTLDNVVFVLSHRELATFNPMSFYIVRGSQIHRGMLQNID